MQPDHAEAHQGLSCILADSGDRRARTTTGKLGFGSRPVVALPYRGERPPVSLLMLSGTAGGNVPIRHFLDDRIFQTSVVFVEFLDPAAPLPPHRIVFNAIGDPDMEAPALVAARRVLALYDCARDQPARRRRRHRPRGQRPAALRHPRSRDLASSHSAARDAGVGDAATTLARHGFEFPMLIRTPGFHMGRHFIKIDTLQDLPAALAELPGDELTVLRYLDSRGADGKVRKYRVMMIDGALYPLHVAISSHWKIHYFSADMAENPEHRAEDAEFLENMAGVLGPRAMAALA